MMRFRVTAITLLGGTLGLGLAAAQEIPDRPEGLVFPDFVFETPDGNDYRQRTRERDSGDRRRRPHAAPDPHRRLAPDRELPRPPPTAWGSLP